MHDQSVPPAGPSSFSERELLAAIQDEVGQRNFEHWFSGQVQLSVAADELIVGVNSPFLATWMQKNFRSAVSLAAQRILGPSARAVFRVLDSAAALEATRPAPMPQPTACAPDPAPAPAESAKVRTHTGRRLCELTDFVAGEANALAFAAAKAVCEEPGHKFNPLFLYGGSGLGKTHLLEGIFRALRRANPELRVVLLRAEAFVNYFTTALRTRSMPNFRQKFRNIDVLLVDEVDFFDSKKMTQEEFLHTFKQLESQGAQIVLTCDRHPRLLDKLSDELVTRCLSGLVCRIDPPDYETRRQIAQSRAAALKADFSPEILDFVAGRFKHNVRELEGALNCLDTYRSVLGRRLTLTGARQALSDLERDCIKIVRVRDVEEIVCRFFGLQPDDLKSTRRHRSVSQPRMLAMFLARKHTQAAYSEIGQHFGGRNHSTVMSAEKKIKTWLRDEASIRVASTSWSLQGIVEALEDQLCAG
jgi:chromosomal replication initiator protein